MKKDDKMETSKKTPSKNNTKLYAILGVFLLIAVLGIYLKIHTASPLSTQPSTAISPGIYNNWTPMGSGVAQNLNRVTKEITDAINLVTIVLLIVVASILFLLLFSVFHKTVI